MEIRRMSPGDMDAACAVLGLAFEDNPNTLAVVRGDRSKARRMMQAAVRAAKLSRKYSHVLLAEDEGRGVGVLHAVEWPKCPLRPAEKPKTAPLMIPLRGLGPPGAV